MEGGSSGSGLPRDAQGREVVGGQVADGQPLRKRHRQKSKQLVDHRGALGPEPLLREDERQAAVDTGADDNGAPEDVPQMMRRRDSKIPPSRVVQEHELTHYPFAPWCDVCIAACGLSKPHRSRPDPNHEVRANINRVHMD